MNRFDLLGSIDLTLAQAADEVSKALGVTFEMRNSDFVGGNYFNSRGNDGEHITVQPNAEDDEGYLIEPDFPAFPVLIYLNRCSATSTSTLERVPGFRLLRTKTG